MKSYNTSKDKGILQNANILVGKFGKLQKTLENYGKIRRNIIKVFLKHFFGDYRLVFHFLTFPEY